MAIINNFPSGILGIIKNIQRGTTLMSSGGTVNQTISSVDTTQSIVIVNSTEASAVQNVQNMRVLGEITSSTQITFESTGTATYDVNVDWIVIEFEGINSLQKGTNTLTDIAETTVTINSVNVNKSLVFSSWNSNSTDQFEQTVYNMKAKLISSTELRLIFEKEVTAEVDSVKFHWQIIEFK